MNLSLQAVLIAATAALTLIVTMTGVIWWQSAKIDRAAEAAAQVKIELSVCQANAASRLAQIERQNAAVEQMKQEADQRRRAALEARDAALEALQQTQGDYAKLREDWPADCVSAVDRVRKELGL
jgi:hypothetical protein